MLRRVIRLDTFSADGLVSAEGYGRIQLVEGVYGVVADERQRARQEHRAFLAQTHAQMQRDYDRLTTGLAGGGLTVSLIVARDFGPHIESLCLAIVSWVCFTAALFSTLASFVTSQILIKGQVAEMDEEEIGPARFATATTVLNMLSGFLLLFGTIFLVWFAGVNLKGE